MIAFVIVAGVLAAPYLVGSAESRSLVVLPCTVIGGEESDQAFCDGLNEAIAGKLAPLTLSNSLQTTAARDAREQGITTAVEARRQFGATLVLQGTLLREGDKVRLNYDLIDATALRQLQGYTVSAASSDPFAIQDHLVEWAAGALALKLTDAERRALIDHDTRNAVAREQYLRVRLSERPARAGECRPRDRPLHAGADHRWAICARLRRARPCLLAEVHGKQRSAVVIQGARGVSPGARDRPAPLGRAVCLGMVSNGAGQYADARAAYKKALESNELSDEGLLGLAFAEEHLGDFNAAEQTYLRAVERRPHYWASSLVARDLLSRKGRYKRPPSSFGKPSR